MSATLQFRYETTATPGNVELRFFDPSAVIGANLESGTARFTGQRANLPLSAAPARFVGQSIPKVLLPSRARFVGQVVGVPLTLKSGIARFTGQAMIPAIRLSGVVTDIHGLEVQRKLYAMSRPSDYSETPLLLGQSVSDINGAWQMWIPDQEATLIVLDEDLPVLNDLAYRVNS